MTADGGMCVNPVPTTPLYLAGTMPTDPTYTATDGTTFHFACYGACGPSCDMVNYVKTQQKICQQWTDCQGNAWHQITTYDVLRGSAQKFCAWHDKCLFLAMQNADLAACGPICNAAMPYGAVSNSNPSTTTYACGEINAGGPITTGTWKPWGARPVAYTAAQVAACSPEQTRPVGGLRDGRQEGAVVEPEDGERSIG
jgi:hypothetical protein